MKVVIIGAGAVGGYFGARWMQVGVDVTFLVRRGRKAQLDETGIVLHSPFGDATLQPKVVTSVEEINSCDVVILAVKNYHLDAVFPTVRALTERGAFVLPLLNGVAHVHQLREVCGEEAVLGGLAQIIATLNEQGEIVHTGALQRIVFGALKEKQKAICDALSQASQSVAFSLVHSQKIWADMWSKYAFITAFSGVTTASRLPIDEVLANPHTQFVYEQMLHEMAQLARKDGAMLPDAYVESMVETVRRMEPGSTSSMHQDFRKGLTLEVESLQGAAVRLAKEHGMSVPVVETVYGLISPYEQGPRHSFQETEKS